MLLLFFTISILEANAEQPVIQYDMAEHAHLPTPHANNYRLEKNLVIIPKVSHEVQYLSNPFRREVDMSYHNAQNIKPVSEASLEPPPPTMSVLAALQATPTPDIFSNLNLNYQVPSYSTPEGFQDSVNALTHLVINKQVKFPSTSYGVPVTDTPEHVKHSTVNALVNMFIGMDKQKKQSDMLSQIVQFMHKKKMQQEQQTLVAQLQQQMQKEQYKPFLQSQEHAVGLVNFMQELLGPLKQQQQGVGSLPLETTSASISHTLPNLGHGSLNSYQSAQSSSTPEVNFDWSPGKPSFAEHQIQQHFAAPAPTTAPIKPTFVESASVQHSIPYLSPQTHGKDDGYVIRLSKPVLMKEDLPTSTTMPKIVHHYMQPVMLETLPKDEQHETNYFLKHSPSSSHFPKSSSASSSSSSHGSSHTESASEMFAPKYEHYIMKHHGEKSKPHLIKLNEEHKFDSTHSSSKYTPKHNTFDVAKFEREFSNGLSHHSSNKHQHTEIEALNFEESKFGYDFVNTNSHNDHEHAVHIHTPSMAFNNHEFDQDFLKDFDQMHFKEESLPGYEAPPSRKPKKSPTKPPQQKFIVVKKVTKS